MVASPAFQFISSEADDAKWLIWGKILWKKGTRGSRYPDPNVLVRMTETAVIVKRFPPSYYWPKYDSLILYTNPEWVPASDTSKTTHSGASTFYFQESGFPNMPFAGGELVVTVNGDGTTTEVFSGWITDGITTDIFVTGNQNILERLPDIRWQRLDGVLIYATSGGALVSSNLAWSTVYPSYELIVDTSAWRAAVLATHTAFIDALRIPDGELSGDALNAFIQAIPVTGRPIDADHAYPRPFFNGTFWRPNSTALIIPFSPMAGDVEWGMYYDSRFSSGFDQLKFTGYAKIRCGANIISPFTSIEWIDIEPVYFPLQYVGQTNFPLLIAGTKDAAYYGVYPKNNWWYGEVEQLQKAMIRGALVAGTPTSLIQFIANNVIQ